jgi:hypothetical protein
MTFVNIYGSVWTSSWARTHITFNHDYYKPLYLKGDNCEEFKKFLAEVVNLVLRPCVCVCGGGCI